MFESSSHNQIDPASAVASLQIIGLSPPDPYRRYYLFSEFFLIIRQIFSPRPPPSDPVGGAAGRAAHGGLPAEGGPRGRRRGRHPAPPHPLRDAVTTILFKKTRVFLVVLCIVIFCVFILLSYFNCFVPFRDAVVPHISLCRDLNFACLFKCPCPSLKATLVQLYTYHFHVKYKEKSIFGPKKVPNALLAMHGEVCNTNHVITLFYEVQSAPLYPAHIQFFRTGGLSGDAEVRSSQRRQTFHVYDMYIVIKYSVFHRFRICICFALSRFKFGYFCFDISTKSNHFT